MPCVCNAFNSILNTFLRYLSQRSVNMCKYGSEVEQIKNSNDLLYYILCENKTFL